MVIYSGFSHWKWWFSIVMLVYQRVTTSSPLSRNVLPVVHRRVRQGDVEKERGIPVQVLNDREKVNRPNSQAPRRCFGGDSSDVFPQSLWPIQMLAMWTPMSWWWSSSLPPEHEGSAKSPVVASRSRGRYQVGFIEFVICPMAESICNIFPQAWHLRKARGFWRARGKGPRQSSFFSGE
jgi:hypothetical protein